MVSLRYPRSLLSDIPRDVDTSPSPCDLVTLTGKCVILTTVLLSVAMTTITTQWQHQHTAFLSQWCEVVVVRELFMVSNDINLIYISVVSKNPRPALKDGYRLQYIHIIIHI